MLILIVGSIIYGLNSKQDNTQVKEIITKFVERLAANDVNGAMQYTTGAMRQRIASQEEKINTLKSSGAINTPDKITVNIVEQNKSYLKANVLTETTEIKGQGQGSFKHLFIVEAQRVGPTWKIANMVEPVVQKKN